MKILYATDLHGQSKKFKLLKDAITDHNLLIIGADVFPKHQSSHNFIKTQETFINGFLSDFLESIEIPVIIDMGNDDCKCLQPDFLKVVDKYEHVYSSHLNKIDIDGVNFIGMHYVPDYPFGLKDWCRRDGFRITDPYQISNPVASYKYGFNYILKFNEYLQKKFSIQHSLSNLPKSENFVFLSHAPPKNLGLDVCMDFRAVGCESVTHYIGDTKPIASLHGHIHESPIKSGKWWNKLFDTYCIQPGQIGGFGSLVYCEFDLNNIEKTLKRKEVII